MQNTHTTSPTQLTESRWSEDGSSEDYRDWWRAGGTAAVIKIARWRERRSVFDVPVKRSHSLCAPGGIKRGQEFEGGRRFHVDPF